MTRWPLLSNLFLYFPLVLGCLKCLCRSALFRSFAPFCAHFRSFSLFRVLAFALFCALLRSFALICLFLRPTAFRTTAHFWVAFASPTQACLRLLASEKSSIRTIVASIIFPPAILGPEMAAPILWAPGIFWFFLLENPHAHKFLVLGGGGGSGFSGRGGWKFQFYFYGRGDFSDSNKIKSFEKGVGRGQRAGARRSFLSQRLRPLLDFSAPFSLRCPHTILRNYSLLYVLNPVSRHPPPTNPFPQESLEVILKKCAKR